MICAICWPRRLSIVNGARGGCGGGGGGGGGGDDNDMYVVKMVMIVPRSRVAGGTSHSAATVAGGQSSTLLRGWLPANQPPAGWRFVVGDIPTSQRPANRGLSSPSRSFWRCSSYLHTGRAGPSSKETRRQISSRGFPFSVSFCGMMSRPVRPSVRPSDGGP